MYFFSRRLIRDSTIAVSNTLNVFNIIWQKSLGIIKHATICIHIIYHIGIREIVCKIISNWLHFIGNLYRGDCFVFTKIVVLIIVSGLECYKNNYFEKLKNNSKIPDIGCIFQ